MSIHFITPASVEFTQKISTWRRQHQVDGGFRDLTARQVAELRWPTADFAPATVRY